MLQEVRRGQALRLARILGHRVRWTRKHYPYTPLLWWLAEGLAILSPGTIDDARRVTLTPDVSSWIYRHRVILAATVTVGDATLRFYNTHFSANDPQRRIAQAELVAALMTTEAHDAAVVGGDLNDTPAVEIIATLATVGVVDPGGELTNPADAPEHRIDYLLVPHTATVTESWTPAGGPQWDELSDHLPVAVAFTMPSPDPANLDPEPPDAHR